MLPTPNNIAAHGCPLHVSSLPHLYRWTCCLTKEVHVPQTYRHTLHILVYLSFFHQCPGCLNPDRAQATSPRFIHSLCLLHQEYHVLGHTDPERKCGFLLACAPIRPLPHLGLQVILVLLLPEEPTCGVNTSLGFGFMEPLWKEGSSLASLESSVGQTSKT